MIQRRETLLRFFLLTTSNVDESFASRTNVCLFWRCNSSKNEYWIGLKPSHSSISESASLTTNCGQATIEIDRRSKYCYSYLSYCIRTKYMVIDILESYKIPQFCTPTHQTTMCNGLYQSISRSRRTKIAQTYHFCCALLVIWNELFKQDWFSAENGAVSTATHNRQRLTRPWQIAMIAAVLTSRLVYVVSIWKYQFWLGDP